MEMAKIQNLYGTRTSSNLTISIFFLLSEKNDIVVT